MKSRILSCFLIFTLCFSILTACGSDTALSDNTPSESSQVEISDSQDSTPGETEERDGSESLDSASSKGDAVPSQSDAPSASQGQQTESSAPTEITTASSFSLSDVPAYSGKAYTSVNGNVPYFTAAELTTTSFETYSDLDTLGRCGVTYACIGQDLMPTKERGSIGMVKPTGWHTVRYDDLVDGKYLYNRCHLIGYQLTGENANTQNLITGTRYLNIEGMLPFENMVADYIQETNNHVLYRVTPIFEGNNLLANGVLMEGYSVEDKGAGVSYCVFAYNVQPGIEIDYATGESKLADGAQQEEQKTATVTPTPSPEPEKQEPATGSEASQADYILNTNTKKFHYPTCSSVNDMKEKNKQEFFGTRDETIALGYSPCGRCKP
jgi:DNA-entry nuclease